MTMTNTAKFFGGFLVLLFLVTCGLAFAAKADEFGAGGSGGTSYSSANPVPTSSGGTGVSSFDPIYTYAQRTFGCVSPGAYGAITGVTSVAYTGIDSASVTITAPSGTAALLTTGTSYGMTYVTGALSGNAAGPTSSGAASGLRINPNLVARSFGQAPAYLGVVAVPAASGTANVRLWVGLATNDTLFNVAPPTASTAKADLVAAWAFDAAVSANWIKVTGDGVNWSGTDSGVAFANDTIYSLVVDTNTSGTFGGAPGSTVRFCINGTCTTKATNVPTNTSTVVSHETSITTTAAAAKTLYVFRMCASRW